MNELIKKEEKWKLLYDRILLMQYGETLLHKEIETIIQENKNINESKYFSIIAKTKRELLKVSKTIKSVTGQGYQVVNPDDYTDLSLKHIKSGFKQVDKGYNILQFAPVNQMSKEGLQRHRHVSDRAMSLQAMMAGGCTELKLLNKKQSKLLPLSE